MEQTTKKLILTIEVTNNEIIAKFNIEGGVTVIEAIGMIEDAKIKLINSIGKKETTIIKKQKPKK